MTRLYELIAALHACTTAAGRERLAIEIEEHAAALGKAGTPGVRVIDLCTPEMSARIDRARAARAAQLRKGAS
jgi:hypothetical protein